MIESLVFFANLTEPQGYILLSIILPRPLALKTVSSHLLTKRLFSLLFFLQLVIYIYSLPLSQAADKITSDAIPVISILFTILFTDIFVITFPFMLQIDLPR